MTAADEKPLVAEGYALLDQGRWYACLRYLRDGKPVGEDLVFKNAPRLNQQEATALAHLQAQRANRGQPLDNLP